LNFIKKNNAHWKLSRRNATPPKCSKTAANAWGKFRGDGRNKTMEYCFQEQKGLCGYSEVQLEYLTPILTANLATEIGFCLGNHLEHIIPKSFKPEKTFDHFNLILSSISSDSLKTMDKADVFGGHARQDWYSADGFIHPLLEDCSGYFHYEISGKVVPKLSLKRREKAKARLTIYKLNLNASILVTWRRNWLEQLITIVDSLLDDEDSLKNFAELELSCINGVLRPFYSAQKQVFGELVVK